MNKTIMILSGCGAIAVMREAYAKAFQKLGWNVIIHSPENGSPTFDVFNKIDRLDVFFGGVYEIDRATLKCLKARKDTQIVLWCPNHGEQNAEIIPEDGVLTATPKDLQTIQELLDNGNKLEYVFTYYHQNRVGPTHSFYTRDFGLKPIGLPLAADLFAFGEGEYREEFDCDWVWCGGYLPAKAEYLNQYLGALCLRNDLKGRAFGYGFFPFAQHIGGISTENMRHLFKSARVCPNLFEKHSLKYNYDVNERAYKILSSGGFCISQRIESAEKDIFTNNEIVFFDSVDDFVERVIHYSRNPDERTPFMERGRKTVLKDHNYFVRVKRLAELYGWKQDIHTLEIILKGLQNAG